MEKLEQIREQIQKLLEENGMCLICSREGDAVGLLIESTYEVSWFDE